MSSEFHVFIPASLIVSLTNYVYRLPGNKRLEPRQETKVLSSGKHIENDKEGQKTTPGKRKDISENIKK